MFPRAPSASREIARERREKTQDAAAQVAPALRPSVVQRRSQRNVCDLLAVKQSSDELDEILAAIERHHAAARHATRGDLIEQRRASCKERPSVRQSRD